MRKKLLVGLTYGDPSGIGPEILQKTLKSWNFLSTPVVIGVRDNLKLKENDLAKVKFCFNGTKIKNVKPGKPNIYTGYHAYECLREAVLLARLGEIDALVTGPVAKYVINMTYKKFSGQTEEIAKSCGINKEKIIMLFVASDLRIALFTRHIPVKNINKFLSKNKLKKFVYLLYKELKKRFSIKNPKIGILGLNPHAGEKGVIGNEDVGIINPVVNSLRKQRLKVFGPLSPDATLAEVGQSYILNKRQKYDVLVAMYHDQALPVFKAVTGFKGVNVTLGLPFLRVSPCHGTAFDISGKNKANNESLISAIKLIEKIYKSY